MIYFVPRSKGVTCQMKGGNKVNDSYKNYVTPSIGDVYLMKFSGFGSEQHGWRPGVVFQNNVGNTHSPNVIALPMTSSIKKLSQPTHVLIPASDSGLSKDSIVLCENPEKMSKNRLGRFLTRLPDEYMKKIATANLLATSAVSYLTKEDILSVWRVAVILNSCVA